LRTVAFKLKVDLLYTINIGFINQKCKNIVSRMIVMPNSDWGFEGNVRPGTMNGGWLARAPESG